MEWFTDRRIQIILVLVQLAVCLPFINSFSIDLDEPFSIYWASQDLGVSLDFLAQGNNPPLHNILLHYWEELFGISPFSVRSMSLLFSLITIPVLYAFSRKILDKNTAVIACGIFIFSSLTHYHSLEARGYSLMILLSVLSFYSLYVLIFQKPKVFWQLAIWNALLLYTHYLGFFIIASEGMIFLLFMKHWNVKKAISFVSSIVLTTLLFLPSLLDFMDRYADFSNNGTWLHKAHWTEIYGNIVRFLNGKYSILLMLAFLLVFLVQNRSTISDQTVKFFSDKKVLFIGAAFGVPYLGMFVFTQYVQPVFLDRYLLYTSPMLFISVAAIYQWFAGRNVKSVWLFISLLPMMVFCAYIPDNNRDSDKMAAFVYERKSPEDLIYIAPGFYDLTFLYAYDRKLFKSFKMEERGKVNSGIQSVYHKNELFIDTTVKQVFFIDAVADLLYPENGIKDSLSCYYKIVEEAEFKGGHMIYIFQYD